MTGWDALSLELDLWRDAGKTASFWWRDDDAVAPSDALKRLLSLSRSHDAGLGLAVVPAGSGSALTAVLRDCSEQGTAEVAVLQHGVAHENTAPAGEKKTELSSAAPRRELLRALQAGYDHLSGLYGERFLPVLVPPWNRIAPQVIAELPALRYRGLSTYKARSAPYAAPGLLQVNSHADLLRWKPERGFLGEEEALTLLCDHLQARRTGTADAREPTGILTHHLVHDEATWDFLDRLLDFLNRHPTTKLLAPSEAFSQTEPATNATTEPPVKQDPATKDPVRNHKA